MSTVIFIPGLGPTSLACTRERVVEPFQHVRWCFGHFDANDNARFHRILELEGFLYQGCELVKKTRKFRGPVAAEELHRLKVIVRIRQLLELLLQSQRLLLQHHVPDGIHAAVLYDSGVLVAPA